MQATGTFTVKMVPLESYANTQPPATLGRMALDKSFSGPLEATSQGEMLTGMTAVKGSAGYVALEKVTGTLEGKSGSFLLQHFGIMHDGDSRLILEVVPASGSGDLEKLAGIMAIRIENGVHYYDFEYTL